MLASEQDRCRSASMPAICRHQWDHQPAEQQQLAMSINATKACYLQAIIRRGIHAAGRTSTTSATSCDAAAEAATRAATALIAEEEQAAAAAQQAKQQQASRKARQKQRKQVRHVTLCAISVCGAFLLPLHQCQQHHAPMNPTLWRQPLPVHSRTGPSKPCAAVCTVHDTKNLAVAGQA